MSRSLRRSGFRVVQYIIAIGAMIWIVSETEWNQAVILLQGIDIWILVILFTITGIEFISRFSMWHVLVSGIMPTRFLTAAKIDLVLRFVNHLVPSRVAGRSIAPAIVHHYTDFNWGESTAVAGVNTGLYAILYGVVSLVGLLRFGVGFQFGIIVLIGLSTVLYLGVGLLIVLGGSRMDVVSRIAIWASDVSVRIPVIGQRLSTVLTVVPQFAEQVSSGFRTLSSRRDVLFYYAISWAMTLMIIPGLRVWLLLSVFDVTFPLTAWLPVILVTAYSVTLLPITPGGVGVAEASATLVLVTLGIPEGVAGAIVLIDRTLGVYLPVLIGWYPVAKLDMSNLAER